MSGAYFRVGAQFWDDPVSTAWDNDTKLVALYVLTCPHRITEGLFKLPVGYVVQDIPMLIKRAQKALARLQGDGFIERDGDYVLIVKALKWQPPKAKANVTHAVRKLTPMHTPLLARLVELAYEHCPDLAEALVLAKPELSKGLAASGAPSSPCSLSQSTSASPYLPETLKVVA
jgi:hypothetical protein